MLFAAQSGAGPSIEDRLRRVEQILSNQDMMQFYTTQQALKQEVSDLQGNIDLLKHELEGVKKQQKVIYSDIDQRIQDLQKSVASLKAMPAASDFSTQPATSSSTAGTAAPSSANAGAGAVPVVTPAAGAQEADTQKMQYNLSEQDAYQAALSALKAGAYNDAIKAFQEFLISYPQSDYAANAQYWMAEAYYVLKNFDTAATQFNKVITTYPNSSKVADAYLKVGFSYYELSKWDQAQKILEKVLKDYPTSTAARLADRRLQKMKLEGHL